MTPPGSSERPWLDPEGPLPRVSIVIPTFNRPEALGATLRAIVELDYPPDAVETIVVDDGGAADPTSTVAEFDGAIPNLRLVRQANQGAAAARNHGASLASGELLVFLDDDMLVEPDHLLEHVRAQRAHGPCLVNGRWRFSDEVQAELESTPFGRFRIELERWMIDSVPMVALGDDRFEIGGTTAANLGILTDVFRALGGFDETFPHAGYEDQDLSVRAAAAGHHFVYCHAIALHHNDQRLTFAQFGPRLRRGALTAVHMAAKDPAWAVDRPFIGRNLPVRRGSSPAAIVRASALRILSTPPALAVVGWLTALIGRLWPRAPFLSALYWKISGLYIFRGVRDGLRQRPGVERLLREATGAKRVSG